MDLNKYSTHPFTKFDKDWAILTVGVEGDYNGMTISWGGMGTIWNKPVVFLLVKPSRYTYEFVERHDEITVSFYDPKYRKALGIFGSTSGRDVDKPKLAGLTPKFLENAGVTFEEATETLVCHKIFMQQLDKSNFPSIALPFYELQNETIPHYLVIAEVKKILN